MTLTLNKNTFDNIVKNTNSNEKLCIIKPNIIICHPSLLLNSNNKEEQTQIKQHLRTLYLNKTQPFMKYVYIPNVNSYPSITLTNINTTNSDFKRWSIIKLIQRNLETDEIEYSIIGQFEIFRGSCKKIPSLIYDEHYVKGQLSNEIMFSLFIDESESHKGIGSKLLQYIKYFGLSKLGIKRLSCLVNTENVGMNKVMQKLEFTKGDHPLKAFTRLKSKYNYYYIRY